MATMTLVRAMEEKEVTMMTPEREEERDSGMDKRRGIDDHDYYGKGKGDKGGGDANDNSGKGMGKGGDSEKGKKVMAMS